MVCSSLSYMVYFLIESFQFMIKYKYDLYTRKSVDLIDSVKPIEGASETFEQPQQEH